MVLEKEILENRKMLQTEVKDQMIRNLEQLESVNK
jgi:hypothetical protein